MKNDWLVIRGAREHNLKNVDLRLPRGSLVVFTGISGSGKSSLAFDTIYAEGQRRYVESLSSYARQFLGQMDKPDVDHIDGLSPAISIDQKSTTRNPRSTVGTITEVYDYLRLLFARIGVVYCPECRGRIQRQTPQQIIERILETPADKRLILLSPLVKGRKGEYLQLLEDTRRQGFSRVRADGVIRDLDEDIKLAKSRKHDIEVVVDRLVIKPGVKRRLADSVETALRLSGGTLILLGEDGDENGLFRELRLPGLRYLLSGSGAAHLLLQQPLWRLPHLLGPRLPPGDRPGPGGPGPFPEHQPGGHRALVQHGGDLSPATRLPGREVRVQSGRPLPRPARSGA